MSDSNIADFDFARTYAVAGQVIVPPGTKVESFHWEETERDLEEQIARFAAEHRIARRSDPQRRGPLQNRDQETDEHIYDAYQTWCYVEVEEHL